MKKWLNEKVDDFSYFYQTQVSLGSGLWVPVSLQELFETLLMYDDTNSILADDANRAIWG